MAPATSRIGRTVLGAALLALLAGCSWRTLAREAEGAIAGLSREGPVAVAGGVAIPAADFRIELERTVGEQAMRILLREALARQRAPELGIQVTDEQVEERLRALRSRDPTVRLEWEGFALPEEAQRRFVRLMLLEEALSRRLAELQARPEEPLQLPELLASLREGVTVKIHDPRYRHLEDQTEPVRWEFDLALLDRQIPAGVNLPKDPAAAVRPGAPLPGRLLPPAAALRSFAYALIDYDYQMGLQGVHQVPRTLREQFFYGRPRPNPGASLRAATFRVLARPSPDALAVLATLRYVDGGVPHELSAWVLLQLLDFAGNPAWKVVRVEPR